MDFNDIVKAIGIEPYYRDNNVAIFNGDCKEILPLLSNIDAIVTDPPYGLTSIVNRFSNSNSHNTPAMNTKEGSVWARKAKGFMGKEWDGTGVEYDVEMWQGCFNALKSGGHLLAFGGTRTYHRMACAIEDAGFEIRDMIEWVYGSGFPKSLNIGKSVNQLETNEWLKISKALDNIDQKSIMEVWKTNAKPAGIQLSKSLTEVGSNTPKKFFVPDIAVLYSNQKNELLNAIIAEMKLKGLSLILEEDGIIAVENAGQTIELLPENARLAVKLSESPNLKCWNIFTAQCDVREWLNENTEVNHKVDEALKTLRGNKKYSNEEITSVLCAGLTDILKLTILSQSNTFQNLDTKSQTDFLSATNVIITEYTAENLISNTVAILKSKAIDKIQGNERERIGIKNVMNMRGGAFMEAKPHEDIAVTKGNTEWEGWGTALKPAHEPICMARKPIKGTVADNVLKYGTGGINIDESRVDYNGEIPNIGGRANHTRGDGYGFKELRENIEANTQGRFPANLIHDGSEEVLEIFPNCGNGNGKGAYNYSGREYNNKDTSMFNGDKPQAPSNFNDNGSAARFFYCAKASKSERNAGLDVIEDKNKRPQGEAFGDGSAITEHSERKGNFHPTVKPIALMEYLIKLITPPQGIVLDPFMGSGSTLIAARKLGYKAIGIELNKEYAEIAVKRLAQGVLL